MLLLHPSIRAPLFVLASAAAIAGFGVLGLAAANGFPLALVWRGLLALLVAAVALRLGTRHIARRPPAAGPSSS